MIDETLFDAEEKMEKAVSVASRRPVDHPHRPGQPRHVLPDQHRLLRLGDPDHAAGQHQRARGAAGRHQALRGRPAAATSRTAIRNSDLGVNPTNDGTLIRVAIPQLTEERRRELVKQAKAKGEDAKVSVRNIRRKAMEELHRIRRTARPARTRSRRAEKDLDKTTHQYVDPDRRAGQAQGRRAAGGLAAAQQATSVADTDTGHRRRAGRQEDSPGPAAICRPRSPWAPSWARWRSRSCCSHR